jgi:hypothetical protein
MVPGLEKVLPMTIEPPPDEVLAEKLNRIREPLLRGATWEITDSYTHGSAAAVIYTLKSPRGKTARFPMMLIQRFDRWKFVLGEITPIRYTEGEKNDMLLVGDWTRKRMEQLSAAAAAASQPATTQATAGPAIAPAPAPAPVQP